MLNALLASDNPGITIFGVQNLRVCHYYRQRHGGGILCHFASFQTQKYVLGSVLTYFCVTLPVALVTTRLFYCITDGTALKGLVFDGIHTPRRAFDYRRNTRRHNQRSFGQLFQKSQFFPCGGLYRRGAAPCAGDRRWGNFANQEVCGAEVTNEALQFFPFAVYINKGAGGSCLQTFTLTFQKIFGGSSDISGGTWHYAFFFYESFVNLVVAALLFAHAWKNPKKPNGLNVAFYFINYGLVRSIMEPLRDPSYILNGGGIKWSFVFSLLMFAAGVALLVTLLLINKKKEGAYIGSANGDPYGITEYLKDGKKEVAYLTNVNMMCKIFPENYVKKPPKEEPKQGEEK